MLALSQRFLTLFAIAVWFSFLYAIALTDTALAPSEEEQQRAVARLRGLMLRRALSAAGATFVKLGQVMSARPDLFAAELIEELSLLQDRLPAFAAAQGCIERALGGPLAAHFAEFDSVPIAAASVAQVHRGRLHSGEEVAVKVLRPGLREQVASDASLLLFGARLAAWVPVLGRSNPVGHVAEFIGGITEQTDLRREAANYAAFARCFEGFAGVKFPRVHAILSSESVMTMEFIRGTKPDALPERLRAPIALILQQAFFKMCFVDGLIHADLHPGNLLVSEAGELVIFDVGLAKHLGDEVLTHFVDFIKCLVMGTPADFVAYIARFHPYIALSEHAIIASDFSRIISRFRDRPFEELELGALANDVFALVRKHHVRPVTDLTLVIVGLVTCEGLGKQLNPKSNIFEDLSAFLQPIVAKRGLSLSATTL